MDGTFVDEDATHSLTCAHEAASKQQISAKDKEEGTEG